MNYYGPRELLDKDNKGTGVWHYIKGNDRIGMYRCGYCNKDKEGKDCPGHANAEDACAHYKQYLIDNAKLEPLPIDRPKFPKHACDVKGCEEEGTHGIQIYRGGGQHWLVCEKHWSKEVLNTLFEVGESWSSY